MKDKRHDYRSALETAAREARAEGKVEDAEKLEQQANVIGAHMVLYPNLNTQPVRLV